MSNLNKELLIKANFNMILREYTNSGLISDEGFIMKSLLDSKEIKYVSEFYDDSVAEAVLEMHYSLYEGLSITDVKIVKEKYGEGLSLKINGIEYRYVSDQYDTKELYRKFTKMMKYSAGKALAWLKKNSVNYYGGKGNKRITTDILKAKAAGDDIPDDIPYESVGVPVGVDDLDKQEVLEPGKQSRVVKCPVCNTIFTPKNI